VAASVAAITVVGSGERRHEVGAFKVALVNRDRSDVPDWVAESLAKEGIEFAVQRYKTRDELVDIAGDADVVWYYHPSEVMTAEDLAALPRCGAIIRTGSGTDNMPVAAATEHGVIVANTPGAVSGAVSDHVIGLLFAILRQIVVHDRALRNGDWARKTDLLCWHPSGRTLGLVGLGNIGQLVARKMSGFEMTILAYDPYVSADLMAGKGVRAAELDEVLSESDFVSICCQLCEDTYHLIGERELRLMKPEAILINTARGSVIDEGALYRALTEGWIAAAGLDVFEQEPVDPDNPMLQLDNIVVTPHIGSRSDESAPESWRLSIETAVALANGHWPVSYVNRDVKPRWELTPQEAGPSPQC
jgi:D-3-phosphoglycerate dehydrogenase